MPVLSFQNDRDYLKRSVEILFIDLHIQYVDVLTEEQGDICQNVHPSHSWTIQFAFLSWKFWWLILLYCVNVCVNDVFYWGFISTR